MDDVEITIERGEWRLIAAAIGASLRGLQKRGGDGAFRDVATTYHGLANKVGGQGDVLVPFPGRISYGKYAFDDAAHQLELTDHEGPSAIHGFLRKLPWAYETTDDSVTFTSSITAGQFPGYPFSLDVAVAYKLTDAGLVSMVTATNTGSNRAPFAVGFHPYFTVGSELIDGDTLHVPFGSYLEFDENLIPTGKVLPVEGSAVDFRSAKTIGQTRFNTCYLDPVRDADGRLAITLSDAAGRSSVSVWLGPTINYVVLYSGDPLPDAHRRRSLAIEPMTCASDAFNHPEWGLVALAPGETFTGEWGVVAGEAST
jgi:aldose 1-epimerase